MQMHFALFSGVIGTFILFHPRANRWSGSKTSLLDVFPLCLDDNRRLFPLQLAKGRIGVCRA